MKFKLVKLDLPPPKPDCSVCNGTGWMRVESHFDDGNIIYNKHPCLCRQEKKDD